MKTSRISGSLVIAAKQCEMMGWPATSKRGYVSREWLRPYAIELVGSLYTLGRSRERGRKRVPRDGPPTCSLQPSVLATRVYFHIFHTRITAFVVGAPPLPPRTGTCRFAMFCCSCEAVPLWCSVRYTWTRMGRCRSWLWGSVLMLVGICETRYISTRTYRKTFLRRTER